MLYIHRFASLLYEMVLFLPAFLLVFSFRGFFKALVATRLGDPTPREERCVTLWPLAHVNIYGILGLLACSLACYGIFATKFSREEFIMVFFALAFYWCVPVSYDERYFKRRVWGSIAVVLASACASLLLVALASLVTKGLLWYGMQHLTRWRLPVLSLCRTLIDVASACAVLDLVPVPPFEAGAIWYYILPQKALRGVQFLYDYSLLTIVVLFLLPYVGDFVLMNLVQASSFVKEIAFISIG